MMRELNRLVPSALNAVRTSLLEEGKVASEFNGYISSFGATIKQCGLPITVVMFAGSTRSKEEKSKLLEAIWYIVNNDGGTPYNNNDFPEYIKDYFGDTANQTNDPLLQYRVERAAIVLKLVIRTFPQT
jgi:CRISPR-associated protein Cmr5